MFGVYVVGQIQPVVRVNTTSNNLAASGLSLDKSGMDCIVR